MGIKKVKLLIKFRGTMGIVEKVYNHHLAIVNGYCELYNQQFIIN